MAYNVYRNGLQIAYCQKKDILPEWSNNLGEWDTYSVEEE